MDVTKHHTSDIDILRRYIVIRGLLEGIPTYLHVVYAPVNPTTRPDFVNGLPRNFEDCANHIVFGDFNTIFSSHLDQAHHGNRARLQGQRDLTRWMQSLCLVDAWRLQNPTKREFTGPKRSSRIDYVLISTALFQDHLRSINHDFSQSPNNADHIGILFYLGSPLYKPQTETPWRFPTWLIELPEAQEFLRSSLEALANRIIITPSTRSNPGCLYDEHKRRDSIFLRQLLVTKTNQRHCRLEALHLRINRLRTSLKLHPTTVIASELCTAQEDLRALQEQQAFFASRKKFASDLEQSERTSKYHLRPPQLLHRVKIPIDSAEDLQEITRSFNQYWSGVYCSPSREYSHASPKWDRTKLLKILRMVKNRISPKEKSYLDAPLTANDIFWALKTMAPNRAPGPDGLPLAYYKTNIHQWSQVLELVLSSQHALGRMTKFQRRGHIILLYKQGNRRKPSNYRPITLLNVDAKVGPKVLARRLGPVLNNLLGSDQYGFVPSRDIRNAHLRFQALQELYRHKAIPAGAVLLDFAKAFDSVLWEVLDIILIKFGFGSNFRRWIRVFFRGTIVSILFNGTPLPHFELGAGVRQGDPLSPALFVLYIEPLLNYIRARLPDIGLQTHPSDPCQSVISFADDCTGLLSNLRDTKRFLHLVEEFCTATGMRLNTNKTVVLPFNPWTEDTATLNQELQQLGIQVIQNDEDTRLLGINYGPRLSNTDRLQHILAKMRERCASYQYRARTLRGRVIILQSLVLPILGFTAAVCHIPKSGFQDEVEKLIQGFMSSLNDSTGRLTTILPRRWWTIPRIDGGLSLPSVEAMIDSLQLHALIRLIQTVRESPINLPSWVLPIQRLFEREMEGRGRCFDILYVPFTKSPNHPSCRGSQRSSLGAFWHQVLYLWHTKLRPKGLFSPSAHDCMSTPFLENTNIRYGAGQRILISNRSFLTNFLQSRQIYTPEDLIDLCGFPLNPTSLSLALQGDNPTRALTPRYTRQLFSAIHCLLHKLNHHPIGPRAPRQFSAAFHNWQFGERDLDNLSVRQIRQIIFIYKKSQLPLEQLQLHVHPTRQEWQRDLRHSKHTLPALGDFLYRLQHNALFLGYRFQHLPEAKVHCPFSCNNLETSPHIFWECPFAQIIWSPWIHRFTRFFRDPITWDRICFPIHAEIPDEYRAASPILHQLWFFAKTIVTRSVWMHRNEIRFHDLDQNHLEVVARTEALFKLHVEAYRANLQGFRIQHSSRLLTQLNRTLESPDFTFTTR